MKEKLRLVGGRQSRSVGVVEEGERRRTEVCEEGLLESPQVVRIRCEESRREEQGSPLVIRRKVRLP